MSDGEKLIILMLSELHGKLGLEGEVEPHFLKSAILSYQLWGIRWKYGDILFDDAEDPAVVKEVAGILEMWRFIERSYALFGDEQKAQLERDAEPFGKDPEFRGFDGNNEPQYAGTAVFLVNELGKFAELKGRSFNCHRPSIDTHRRMLEVFEPMRGRLSSKLLSVG